MPRSEEIDLDAEDERILRELWDEQATEGDSQEPE